MSDAELAEAERLALARLRRAPAASTIRQYDRVVRQMTHQRRSLADMTSSRSQFYRARAAVICIMACYILQILEAAAGRTVTADERRKVLAARAYMEKAQAMSPPPRHGDDGGSGASATRRTGSRRTVLKRLRRQAHFLGEPLFDAVRAHGDDVGAIAVLQACAARPAEIATGVHVSASGSDASLTLTVYGVKVNAQRGYRWREVRFDDPSRWRPTRYLRDAARAAGGETIIQTSTDSLRRSLKKAARDVVGRTGDAVTPYVLRHLAACRLKQRAGLAFAARILGHASQRSTRRYGGARGGGPEPDHAHVPARAPEPDPRATHGPTAAPGPGGPN